MFNEYYRWGILGAWIWVGFGCADNTSQIVDDKLAHIAHEEHMAISEPVPIHLSVPMTYQQGKDPFINPYRDVAVLDTNHAADQQDETKTESAKAWPMADAMPSQPPDAHQSTKAQAQVFKGDPIAIDTNRVREPLESYELSSLRYHGSISDDVRLVALIMSPDGIIHRVITGQYLGKNHGKITHIDSRTIHLIEAVADTQGGYYRRDANIHFIHKQ